MPLLALSALTVMMAAEAIAVRSSTPCPATEQITAKLQPLLSSTSTRLGLGGDVALVDSVPAATDESGALRLRLLRSDGSVGGEKQLPMQGGCDNMAGVVATVITVWEINLPPPPEAPGLHVVLGGSAGAALIGGVAAAGSIEAVLGRGHSRWQLRLAGMAELARSTELAGGTVSWQHTALAAGVRLQSRGAWRLAADAGPILGWARLAGHGNGKWQDGQQDVLEYGGGVGARVERWWGRMALWLEWRTHLWSQRQQATVTGVDAGSDAYLTLSRFDMMVSLGGSVAVLP